MNKRRYGVEKEYAIVEGVYCKVWQIPLMGKYIFN